MQDVSTQILSRVATNQYHKKSLPSYLFKFEVTSDPR